MGEDRAPLDRLDELLAEWRALGVDPQSSEMVALLAYASHEMRRRADDVLTEHGLTHELFDVMAALYRSGHTEGLTQAELAGRMLVTQAGMLKRVRNLEHMGLVSHRPDPADRRKHLIGLTASGRSTIARVVGPFMASQDRAAATLKPNERRRLIELLRTLARGYS